MWTNPIKHSAYQFLYRPFIFHSEDGIRGFARDLTKKESFLRSSIYFSPYYVITEADFDLASRCSSSRSSLTLVVHMDFFTRNKSLCIPNGFYDRCLVNQQKFLFSWHKPTNGPDKIYLSFANASACLRLNQDFLSLNAKIRSDSINSLIINHDWT